MALILCLQFVIVFSLIRASRNGVEESLPVFAFFVVLMPLESRLVLPGLGDVTTMRVCLVTLLALYMRDKGPRDYRPIPLKFPMMLNVAWAICSTAYSLSVMTSVKQLISQVVEYYLMYFLFVRTITKMESLYRILFGVVMALGVCSCFSFLEAYQHYSILRLFPPNLWITYNGGLDPLYVEWGRGLRVRSTFPHPILFGDALAMGITICLYLLSIWENGKQRLLLWTALIVMVWAIYKTSSRGPWIATCLCFVLMFLLVNNRVRRYLAIVAVLAVLVIILRPGIRETIENLYLASTDSSSPVGASYLYRDTLTESVKAAVAKDPARMLLGYGLGTFRELGLDITFLGVTQRWFTCDNNWDAFLYETGYVGLFLIGCLLAAPLWIAFRNYRTLPRPDNRLSGVLLICLIGFYFLLMSVAGYSWGQQGYLNWILISLVIAHSRVVSFQNPSEEELEVVNQSPEEAVEYDLHLA